MFSRFLLVAVLILFAGAEVIGEPILSICFERKSSNSVLARTLRRGERFQVIPAGGLDNQKEWFTAKPVGPGDTIVSKGGQYQEYLLIQKIEADTVWIKRRGFAKGLGEFREEIRLAISSVCSNSSI